MKITDIKLRTLRHPSLTQSRHRLIQVPGLRRIPYTHSGLPTREPMRAPVLQMASDGVRGRVFASDYMFFYLGSALSSSVVGAALDTSLSVSSIIWAMAALSVVPMVLWTVWVARGSRAGI